MNEPKDCISKQPSGKPGQAERREPAFPEREVHSALLNKTSAEGGRAKILLVDRSFEVQDHIRSLLEADYEVIAVDSVNSALREIKKGCPDLVLAEVPRLGSHVEFTQRRQADGLLNRLLPTGLSNNPKKNDAIEKRYRLLFELNPNPMWIFDESTLRFLAVNEAAVKLYGWSREEFLSMTIKDVRPLKEVPKLERKLAVQRGSRLAFVGEWHHWKKDGTVFSVEVTISCLQFQGRDARLTMVNDVSERKRSEEALRENEQRLKADLNATKKLAELGMLFVREDNLKPVLTAIVDAAIEISGADFGNIQLRDADSAEMKIVAHRGFPKWWIEFWNNMPKGQGACRMALERGERVIVEDVERSPIFTNTRALRMQLEAGVRAEQSTPLVSRSGEVLGIFSTHYKTAQRPDVRTLRLLDLLARQASDLIERARADAALQESEQRLALAASGSHIGMFEWNIATGKMRWTEQQSRLLGIPTTTAKTTTRPPPRSLNYHYRDWAKRVHPQDLPRVKAKLRRCMSAHVPFEAEYRVVSGERNPHWITSRGVFQYDAHQQPYRMLGMIMDITARKQAEEKLRHFNASLERCVATRTEELTRANQLLLASEQALADFFDEAPFGLLLLAPDGRVLRANQAQADLLGCSVKELLGQCLTQFCAKPEVVRAMILKLARKESMHDYLVRLLRKDRAIRHVLFDANGAWKNGRLTHSRWFVRNVSAQVELQKEILATGERVRRQIGHDLHDNLCQQLTSIEYLGRALERELGVDSKAEAARAREITSLTRQAIAYTRGLSHAMSPMEGGLLWALKDLAAQTKRLFHIECVFRGERNISLDSADQTNLYCVVLEAIQNAIKHGKARRIHIGLVETGANIVLRVQDDGVGIPLKPQRNKGFGLRIMDYRARTLGGSLAVKRGKSGGTILVCSIPKSVPAPAVKRDV